MVKKARTDLERMLSKVQPDPETGCWNWLGKLDKDGYGQQVRVGSRTDGTRRVVRPHRLMYELFLGVIPEGLVVDHKCRNRACQNPLHLEPVTNTENTKRGARAMQTHCKRGHPLFGDNVRVSKQKSKWINRVCKTCAREYQATHQKANGRAHQKAYRERCKEKQNRTR